MEITRSKYAAVLALLQHLDAVNAPESEAARSPLIDSTGAEELACAFQLRLDRIGGGNTKVPSDLQCR
ncbi:hypothetical protein ACFWNL_22190 [Kitasatospora sp. NPDC058397]|uniref:hypothetical protein n=1 Tax=unclassified Kitasatospora TaxID=2633591 RepID=UPI0036636E13